MKLRRRVPDVVSDRFPECVNPARPASTGPGPATIVAYATGIIFLATDSWDELWCKVLGYAPKVQSRAVGSCLLHTCDFAHKTDHENRADKRGARPASKGLAGHFG
jgi:hypothetical protein